VQRSIPAKPKTLLLYDHFEHSMTSEQFVKFLDALEHSRNISALIILDPGRQINQVPDSLYIAPLERTQIHPHDAARILHDNWTGLSENWTILLVALQLNEEEWA
jgi:hypothetical protein